ncbi:helix-turn-helix domain-containing protein [Geodermatophilus sp. DSM 44513]|uniref:helix-turn-helix domain-containing protein n=1 Tax=Geodermatophilus sp. DSM 44513 TaxID=1528104 RepID=UPI0012765DE6|nr:helix-turn-helix domain-containing protein [Geodermatophilus sp. DSM 44513]WNV75947.1 GAF domain-containing protein [Geodermatophilus sp. DSM 44513]
MSRTGRHPRPRGAPGVPGVDAVAHARQLAETFDDVLGGGPLRRSPRPVVSASWARSLAAHVDPDRRTPPVVYAPDELADVRSAHPLAEVVPLLRGTLATAADEAVHLLLVTDAAGRVLWREGSPGLLGRADRVGLFPGTDWSEAAIGTNAMGTTLAVDAPVQIHSAEHLVRTYHAWTCVAAPVHDPDTGAVLGAVDLSGPLQTVHPAMAQLVATTARLAEAHLRARVAEADQRFLLRHAAHLAGLRGAAGALVTPTGRVLAADPDGRWPARVDLAGSTGHALLPDGREVRVEPLAEGHLLVCPRPAHRTPVLSLRLTGTSPGAVLDGRAVPLTLRAAEVLTALVLHPEGLTADQLGCLLYGDDGNQTTVRVQVRRLRSLLGADVLGTRPYRLTATVDSDVGQVRRALREGRPAAALRGCAGPLLPRSEVAEVRQLREELAAGLRRAVLGSSDVDLLHAFVTHPLGEEDLAAHDRLLALLPDGDPRTAPVALRAARLRAE